MTFRTGLRNRYLRALLSLCIILSLVLTGCNSTPAGTGNSNTSSSSALSSEIQSGETQPESAEFSGYCYTREVHVNIPDTGGEVSVRDISGAGGRIIVGVSISSEDNFGTFLQIYDTSGNLTGELELLSGYAFLMGNGNDTFLLVYDENEDNFDIIRVHPEDVSLETIGQLALPEGIFLEQGAPAQILPDGTIVLNGNIGEDYDFENSEPCLLFYATDGTFLGKYTSPDLNRETFFINGEIYASLISYDGNPPRLVLLDPTGWTAEEPFDSARLSDPRSAMYFGNDLFNIESDGIYLYSDLSSPGQQVVRWLDSDMDWSNYSYVDSFSAISENCFVCYPQLSSSRGTFVIMTCSDTHPKAGKTELVIGGFINHSSDLNYAVQQFNRTSDTYYISVTDYSTLEYLYDESSDTEDKYEKLYSKLMQDILSGTGPDLLFFGCYQDAKDCCHFEKAGFLLDLTPYLQGGESGLDSLLPNVLAASTSDSRLCKIPYSMILRSMCPNQDISQSSIENIADFERAMSDLPEGSVAISNLSQLELMTQLFAYGYDDYIYSADGKLKFDADRFAELLEFSKKYGWTDYTDEKGYQYFLSGRMAIYDTTFSSPWSMFLQMPEYFYPNGYVDPISLPCHTESAGEILPDKTIAVTSTSAHPEGAAEFIRYILSKEFQSYLWGYWGYMPVRKEILEYIVGDVPYPEDFKDFSRASSTDRYDDGQGFITDFATDEEIREMGEKFKPLLLGSNFLYYPDRDLEKIIAEEAAAFFSGQKSAMDVAKIVENRVLLLLAERG
jgi:hypothetical protein